MSGLRRKTKQDYFDLARRRGLVWVGGEIPSSTVEKSRWQCPLGHQWMARYSRIKEGSGCPHCAGLYPKSRTDYHAVAKANGVQWVGERVLPVNEKTLWRLPGGILFEDTYSNMRRREKENNPIAKKPNYAMRRRIDVPE